MDKLFKDFELYCTEPGKKTGKAYSYAKSMKYLCEYLNLSAINESTIELLRNKFDDLKDKNSAFYIDFLNFLAQRKQTSYLDSGFVSAALPNFCDYLKTGYHNMRDTWIYRGLSKEQWKDFLLNFDKVLSKHTGIIFKKIVDILFMEEKYKLCASTIADLLGYSSHSPLNSIVGNVGKKLIQRYSLKNLPYRDNGSVGAWNVVFDGGNASVKNKFDWILKPEFIQAFIEISEYNNKVVDYCNGPLFLANITWMMNYNGKELFSRPGAAFVRENDDAYEKYNFKNCDGKYYGFVQCSRNNKINLDKISQKYGCNIWGEGKDRYIENALVVFFSTLPNGGTRIVGFYKKAKIYEYMHNIDNDHFYYFESSAEDGYLIPIDNRDFVIPKVYNDVHVFGQDQRCYAVDSELEPLLIDIRNYINEIVKIEDFNGVESTECVLLNRVTDSQISVVYDEEKFLGCLPINNFISGNSRSKINGTSMLSSKKIIGGRRAEKYVIDFFKHKNFSENFEFVDVANYKNYSYDIDIVGVIGLEIKNIKSASFYLTYNEIEQILNKRTHLVLVDINNGIWLLKNNSNWLMSVIKNINALRKYCSDRYFNLEVKDIKINIDESLKDDRQLFEISKLDKNKILELLCN